MGVTDQMLRLLGLTGPPHPIPLPGPPPTAVQGRAGQGRDGQRELADAMRRLPECFRDRLPASMVQRVVGAAASGRWETAVDQLVMALYMRGAPVSAAERAELRDVLAALGVPAHRLDRLPSR